MTSLFFGFGLFSILSLAIFILTLVYRDKLDDEILPILVLFSIISFVSFTLACVVAYESDEDMYGKCMKSVNKEEYCIKYLREQSWN